MQCVCRFDRETTLKAPDSVLSDLLRKNVRDGSTRFGATDNPCVTDDGYIPTRKSVCRDSHLASADGGDDEALDRTHPNSTERAMEDEAFDIIRDLPFSNLGR